MTVKAEQVEKKGGESLLHHYYSHSLFSALSVLFPGTCLSLSICSVSVSVEYRWIAWKFAKVPQGFWNSPNNQRLFFDWMAEDMNMKTLEDWYNVSVEVCLLHFTLFNRNVKEVEKRGGSILMQHFGGSLRRALSTVYSDYNWQLWRFGQVPSGHWEEPKNQRQYLDWLSGELQIESFSEWYLVSLEDIQEEKRSYGPLLQHGSLMTALSNIYLGNRYFT